MVSIMDVNMVISHLTNLQFSIKMVLEEITPSMESPFFPSLNLSQPFLEIIVGSHVLLVFAT
jgi:hypothetical protein